MEARVRRAALSAAIRVTISTTLIGCGGRVGTDFPDPEQPATPTPSDASEGSHDTGGSYARSPGDQAPTAGTYGAATAQAGQSPAAQGGSGASLPMGGAAPNEEAGAPGAAGAPEEHVCGGQKTQMCLAYLESITTFPPPTGDALAVDCCTTVINPTAWVPEVEPGCEDELLPRIQAQTYPCCRVLDTFEGGCTPWGPPVPPELSAALLRAWLEVAA
jgi:hypothetical protein